MYCFQEKEQAILDQDAYSEMKCELAPEFLNKLREDTQPIIENGVAHSPSKTPQSNSECPKTGDRDRTKVRRFNLFPPGVGQIQEGSCEDHGCGSDSHCQSHEQCPGSTQRSDQSAGTSSNNTTAERTSNDRRGNKEQSGNNSLNGGENRRKRSGSAQSSTPSNWDSVYDSCKTSESASVLSAPTDGDSQQPRCCNNSGSFQRKTDSKSGARGDSRGGGAQGRGGSQRAGRSDQLMHLGDFVVRGDQRDSTTDKSAGQQRGRSKKGRKKKQAKGGQGQGGQPSGVSKSFSSPGSDFASCADDFPSIR